jgi:hypothetical protein
MNPFTALLDYHKGTSKSQFDTTLLIGIIPLILMFAFNVLFNKLADMSFCNLKDKKCEPPTAAYDPVDPVKQLINCPEYDYNKPEKDSLTGYILFNWAVTITFIGVLIWYGLTKSSASLYIVFLVLASLAGLYSLGASIDNSVNKNPNRTVFSTILMAIMIIVSVFTVLGVQLGFSPFILAGAAVIMILPLFITFFTHKELLGLGYINFPVLKAGLTSVLTTNLLVLIMLIVNLGTLYAGAGFGLDTFKMSTPAIFGIIMIIIQVIIYGVFETKCTKPEYKCIPDIEIKRDKANYSEIESTNVCKLHSNKTMDLKGAKISLAVFISVLMLIEFGYIWVFGYSILAEGQHPANFAIYGVLLALAIAAYVTAN